MALQLSYDDDFGSTHATAYHKVVNLTMNVLTKNAVARVGTFKDASASAAGKDYMRILTYEWNDAEYDAMFLAGAMDVKNPIAAVYDNIKIKPEWSGATDV